jgi:hypothetical protein
MTTIVLRMTRSEQMALIDVLLEHVRDAEKTQVFVDCSTDTKTTTADLLQLVCDLREFAVSA